MFHSRMQQQSESFDSFLTDLKIKAQTCNFESLRDSMVRDQIVFGIGDKKVRERLLREVELTLEAAIKICHANLLSQKHLKTFSEMGDVNVKEDVDVGAISRPDNAHQSARSREKMDSFSCKRCGTQHKPRQCPAFGKQCSNCQGKNHLAKQCFSKRN